VLAPFIGPEDAAAVVVAARGQARRSGTAAARLALPAGAALGEVREDDADEQRYDDDDDERRVA